jgi:hypothetical protein
MVGMPPYAFLDWKGIRYRASLALWSKRKGRRVLPLEYLGRIDEGLSADGAAILQAMKAEFLIDK